jgi:uncharacterized OB-fold protein
VTPENVTSESVITATSGTRAELAVGVGTAGAADWLVASELEPDAADPDLAPLYEAAARGVLVMPFCAACGTAVELEQDVCDRCGTTGRQWRETEKAGTVHAVTIVHRREPGLIVAGHPYPVVDVELASGHRLVLTTAAEAEHAPEIGTPVGITFRTVGAVAVPALTAVPALAGEGETTS